MEALETEDGKKFLKAVHVLNVGKDGKPKKAEVETSIEEVMRFMQSHDEVLRKELPRLASFAASEYLFAMSFAEFLDLFEHRDKWAKKMVKPKKQTAAVKSWMKNPKSDGKLKAALVEAFMEKISKHRKPKRKQAADSSSEASVNGDDDDDDDEDDESDDEKSDAKEGSDDDSEEASDDDGDDSADSDDSGNKGAKKNKKQREKAKAGKGAKKNSKRKAKDAKAKKAAASKKAKKAKSSSEDSSSEAKDKKDKKKAKEAKRNRDSDEDEDKKPKKAKGRRASKSPSMPRAPAAVAAKADPPTDEKAAAFTTWLQSDVQAYMSQAANTNIRLNDGTKSTVPSAVVKDLAKLLPDAVLELYPDTQKAVNAIPDGAEIQKSAAKNTYDELLKIGKDAETFYAQQQKLAGCGNSSGSAAVPQVKK